MSLYNCEKLALPQQLYPEVEFCAASLKRRLTFKNVQYSSLLSNSVFKTEADFTCGFADWEGNPFLFKSEAVP